MAEAPHVRKIREQLARFLGEEKARGIVELCMQQAQLDTISSAQESLAFAEALCRCGGMIEVVGRSLKAQAILKGARVEAAAAHDKRTSG